MRGVPGPDARQDLGIFGDRGVTEAGIEMAVVGRVEDDVEASIEEERDGEVHDAMVPLIRCLDASRLRDARGWDPLYVERVQQNTAGCV